MVPVALALLALASARVAAPRAEAGPPMQGSRRAISGSRPGQPASERRLIDLPLPDAGAWPDDPPPPYDISGALGDRPAIDPGGAGIELGTGAGDSGALALHTQNALAARIFLPWSSGGAATSPEVPTAVLPTAGAPSPFAPTAEVPDEATLQLAEANDLTSVVIDRTTGEVWSGSHGGGLLRWDIRTGTYTRFTAPTDLADNRVLALTRSASGRLWIGTYQGASYLDPGATEFVPVRLPDGRPLAGRVSAIYPDSAGNTWFGVDLGGVWRLAPDGGWTSFVGPYLGVQGASQPIPLHDSNYGPLLEGAAPIRGPLVWLGSACGSIGPAVPAAGFVALVEEQTRVGCGVVDAARRAQSMGAAAVVAIPIEYIQYSAVQNPDIRVPVLMVQPDSGHELRDRLVQGDVVTVSLGTDGAPDLIEGVSSLAVDHAGDLWVGSYDHGVRRRSAADGRWYTYRANPPIIVQAAGGAFGLGYAFIENAWPLAYSGEVAGELVWLGEACPGQALRADPRGKVALVEETPRCSLAEQFEVVEAAAAIAFVRYRVPLEFFEGERIPPSNTRMPGVQIGNDDGLNLVARLVAGESVRLRFPLRLTGDAVSAVAVDRAGNRWIGTAEAGISIIGTDERLVRVYHFGLDQVEQQKLDEVHSIAFDTRGNAWVGTVGGLRRLAIGGGQVNFTNASTSGGLPADFVRDAIMDEKGDLWAATALGLVRQSQDGTWGRLFAERNLLGNWYSAVAVDTFNEVWFGAAPPFFLGEPAARYFNTLAVATGLAHVSANRADWHTWTQSSTWGALKDDAVMALQADPNGPAMWIGTMSGLTRADLATGQLRPEPQTARVSLHLAGRAQMESPAFELPFAKSAASIEAPLALYGPTCPDTSHQPELEGRIALVERSTGSTACPFFDQLMDAQRLGAVGVLAYVTDPAQTVIQGYLFDPELHTPSMLIPEDLGRLLASALHRGDAYEAVMLSGPWGPRFFIDSFHDLALDGDGNLWIARWGSIDQRSPDGVWRNLHYMNSGLGETTFHDASPWSLAIDRLGGKWFGHVLGYAFKVSPDELTWREVRDAEGRKVPEGFMVLDIAIDHNDDLWFSVGFNGLWRLGADGRRFEHISRASTDGALLSDFVSAIKFDGEGNGWFSTANGVSRLDADGETWWSYPVENATGLDIDHDGDLWIATGGLGITQLSRRDPGTDCATALPLSPGAVIDTKLTSQSDVDLYAIRVDKPFSRIEITVPDPEQQLDLFLRRSCIGIGSFGRHIGSFGRHIGSFGRHIGGDQRLVFDVLAETGTYYVDVRPRIGTQDKPIPYRLRSGLAPVDLDSRRTLILTDASAVRNAFGLAADDPEYLDWLDGLRTLQADSGVAGLLISDLRSQTNDAVRDAYAAWLANDEPARTNALANTLVLALRDWIWERKAEDLPRLQYIVPAGDERIIPHFRLGLGPTAPGSGRLAEPDYLAAAGIDPDSTVGLALAADRVLTDDPYAAPAPAGYGPGAPALHAPVLAVGRLVEHPATMSRAIEAFLTGRGVETLQASLVAGTGPFEDAARLGQSALAETGLPSERRGALVGAGWGSAQLGGLLAAEPRQVLLTALSGDHASLGMGDGTTLSADAIPTSPGGAGNIVLSLASHGALNAPGPAHPRSRDWPEAWLDRGAALVGSTSYAYGLEGELQYAEKLQNHFLRLLVQGDGRVVGDALVAAKQDYLGDIGSASDLHAATVAGTILYGLPMARLEVTSPAKEATDRIEASAWGAEASGLAAYQPGRSTGSPREVAPGTWALRVSQRLEAARRQSGAAGTWHEIPGSQPRLEAGQAVQPQQRVDLAELVLDGPTGPAGTTAGARSLPVRGLLWLGGRARAVAGVERPWWLGAIASARGAAAGQPGDSVLWQPALPVVLRSTLEAGLAGEVLVARRDGRVLYTGGQWGPGTGQWLFDTLETEEYYGAGEDREGAAIDSVAVAELGGERELAVRAQDASGLLRAVAVWTLGDGEWRALELAEDGAGSWRGRMPEGARALVQAVDRAGNVAVDDRGGRLWP